VSRVYERFTPRRRSRQRASRQGTLTPSSGALVDAIFFAGPTWGDRRVLRRPRRKKVGVINRAAMVSTAHTGKSMGPPRAASMSGSAELHLGTRLPHSTQDNRKGSATAHTLPRSTSWKKDTGTRQRGGGEAPRAPSPFQTAALPPQTLGEERIEPFLDRRINIAAHAFSRPLRIPRLASLASSESA